MTIHILVNGSHGKMGSLAVKILSAHPDFSVTENHSHSEDLAAAMKKNNSQVVLDFTNAASVLKNTEIIIDAGVHPVIGTSGLLKEDVFRLQKRCAELKLGGIIAPNFSLGAVLMMKCAAETAKYFNEVEIIEMHHAGKLDSPSGTALRTAEMIAAARKKPTATSSAEKKATVPGARGATYEDIAIHAIRLPGFVASQQVIFGGTGETLSIRHDSIDRQCFMPGVVLACKKVIELKQLIYGLEGIL